MPSFEADRRLVEPGSAENKSRIRVLHVADKLGVSGSSVDGVARLLAWWFPRLEENGIDPKLLVLGPSGSVVQEMQQQGIPVRCIGMKPIDPRAYLEFKRTVVDMDPQLIHAHNWRATTFALWLKRSLGIPVVVHEHIISPNIPFVQQVADRILNRRVDRVIAVSEGVARSCVRSRGFPADRVQVMLNGLPLETRPPSGPEDRAALRKDLGIPEAGPIVGFVGRLDEQKGPRYLIEAFRSIKEREQDAVLVLIGDGPHAGDLKELALSMALEDDVFFLGYRTDVRDLQQLFCVQVMPSLWEGLGLVALEAMLSQVPLVASNIPGPDEILEDDVNAILVPPRDPTALSAAILRLLGDEDLRRRLAREGRRIVAAYDIERNVDDLARLYREIST